jgi:methionyl aminopeptidase
MKENEIQNYKKAGEITKKAVEYAKTIVKQNIPLLEIAEKIEAKILELGGKPAFPVNLSINEIAAHATPSYNDSAKASGLIKVDIGTHIDGYAADTALSIDLENSEENKNLIKSTEEALKNAISEFSLNKSTNQIGAIIEKTIKSQGFHPVSNLSGHSISHYNLHSGINIPNTDNSQNTKIKSGVYAIEPFATPGLGLVIEGKPSGIYHLEKDGNVREPFAREVLKFIKEEYKTLPFCSRWIYKKFGTRGLLALKRIEESGLLHHYKQLVEKSKSKVAQAEHTILITENEKAVTTK